MKFGNIDINDKDPQWNTWKWSAFVSFYETNIKPHASDSIEDIAKALGVKIPDPPKAKKGDVVTQ